MAQYAITEGYGGWSYLACPVTEVRTAILQNRPYGIVTQLARGNCVAGSNPAYPTILGCRQGVRHQTLTLTFVGSNPASPAKKIRGGYYDKL